MFAQTEPYDPSLPTLPDPRVQHGWPRVKQNSGDCWGNFVTNEGVKQVSRAHGGAGLAMPRG
jgi:hypothetical protein